MHTQLTIVVYICVAHHFSLFCELQLKCSLYIYAHSLYSYEHLEKTEMTGTHPRFHDLIKLPTTEKTILLNLEKKIDAPASSQGQPD